MEEPGVWIEINMLISPAYNDSEKNINGIIDFILSVDDAIPYKIKEGHRSKRAEIIDGSGGKKYG